MITVFNQQVRDYNIKLKHGPEEGILDYGRAENMQIAVDEAKKMTMRGMMFCGLPYCESKVVDNKTVYAFAFEFTKENEAPKHITEEN